MIVIITRLEWGDEVDAVLGPIFDNEVPAPMTQEEIVQPLIQQEPDIIQQEPNIIQQEPNIIQQLR